MVNSDGTQKLNNITIKLLYKLLKILLWYARLFIESHYWEVTPQMLVWAEDSFNNGFLEFLFSAQKLGMFKFMDPLNVCKVKQQSHQLGGHWFSFIYFPIVGLSCTFIKPKSVEMLLFFLVVMQQMEFYSTMNHKGLLWFYFSPGPDLINFLEKSSKFWGWRMVNLRLCKTARLIYFLLVWDFLLLWKKLRLSDSVMKQFGMVKPMLDDCFWEVGPFATPNTCEFIIFFSPDIVNYWMWIHKGCIPEVWYISLWQTKTRG